MFLMLVKGYIPKLSLGVSKHLLPLMQVNGRANVACCQRQRLYYYTLELAVTITIRPQGNSLVFHEPQRSQIITLFWNVYVTTLSPCLLG